MATRVVDAQLAVMLPAVGAIRQRDNLLEWRPAIVAPDTYRFKRHHKTLKGVNFTRVLVDPIRPFLTR